MIAGLRAPKMAKGYLRPPEVRSETCLNCGAPLIGPFCAQCGQRDVPPYPSVRELVTDAFWELSGWDGRFAGTVRALLAHPGKLTTEFLEGRRVRYVSPLRLYLVASLVYFLVAAAAPNLQPKGDVDVAAGGIRINVDRPGPQRVSSAAREATRGDITSAQRDSALKDIERAPTVMRPVLRRVVSDPKGFQRGLIESMPRVLFALVPVFAAILALFYRGRRYPEHLYFSLHTHAFVFVALTLGEIAKFTHLYAVSAIVGGLASLWIAVYAVKALRHVYRGSLRATVAKAAAAGLLYAVAGSAAMLGLVYWAAVFT